jgi:hypothetical protein
MAPGAPQRMVSPARPWQVGAAAAGAANSNKAAIAAIHPRMGQD